MCLNRDDMCAASRFYLHQCRQQGVYLPPPKECGMFLACFHPHFFFIANSVDLYHTTSVTFSSYFVTVQCVAPNAESFEAGETIRISSRSDDYQPISSADTIFIVEEKPCNKETTKHLGSLVYEVEQELTKAGMFSLNTWRKISKAFMDSVTIDWLCLCIIFRYFKQQIWIDWV